MRQQVGALPIRWTGDELSVLLVTSRDTQRWIIPKGWRMRGRSDAEAAAQEALEEAGVRGRVRAKPIGSYRYLKRRADAVEDCRVTTYLLEVVDELMSFPEMDERRRSWFTVPEAAACADDLGLRDILLDLEPRLRAERAAETGTKKRKAGNKSGNKTAKSKTGKGSAAKAAAAAAKALERNGSDDRPATGTAAAAAIDPPASRDAPAPAVKPPKAGAAKSRSTKAKAKSSKSTPAPSATPGDPTDGTAAAAKPKSAKTKSAAPKGKSAAGRKAKSTKVRPAKASASPEAEAGSTDAVAVAGTR